MEVKDINSIAAMLVSNRSQKTEGQNGGQTALQWKNLPHPLIAQH